MRDYGFVIGNLARVPAACARLPALTTLVCSPAIGTRFSVLLLLRQWQARKRRTMAPLT